MIDVVATEDFEAWYMGLDDDQTEAVDRVVGLLEAKGVALGFPYSSQLKGTDAALRELRIKSAGHQLRVIYAFDPARRGVLILGGDKTGDDRFYERNISRAEELWKRYKEQLR